MGRGGTIRVIYIGGKIYRNEREGRGVYIDDQREQGGARIFLGECGGADYRGERVCFDLFVDL